MPSWLQPPHRAPSRSHAQLSNLTQQRLKPTAGDSPFQDQGINDPLSWILQLPFILFSLSSFPLFTVLKHVLCKGPCLCLPPITLPPCGSDIFFAPLPWASFLPFADLLFLPAIIKVCV
ncbi:hypothetical protein GQ54DRAFT_96370 [Martensiomyces pterosporus]|nr:hypothetical protein GQ54DRAFT_96370 [Martensiomyces pterosporus]